jgi:hypothetical protein
MISRTEVYNRGYSAGRRNAATIHERMAATYRGWRAEFPTAADFDFDQELLKLDRERLSNPPSYTRFPEARGWPDLIVAERQGFLDGSGCGPAAQAFHYNYLYYMACRLYAHHVGNALPPGECTAVFIRDSTEGGPLYGRNCDGPYSTSLDIQPPRRGPDGVRRLWFKGVSCWTPCDEEPQERFPLEAWRVLPDDCRGLPAVIEFLTHYVEYWWACNGIIVDDDLNCVAFERSNCRIAWRHTDNGTAAVTSCSYLIPEMNRHRDRCLRRALALRGDPVVDDDCATLPDWKYWRRAEARYRRLLKLVDEAATKGPSLDDMAAIMTDHDASPGERICHAGESCHPAIPAGAGTWTSRSRAAVLHGPRRRTLFWNYEGKQACYSKAPYLILGEGVEMQPEWQRGTRPAPSTADPDDEMEAYRQYEFDYPITYPL